MIVICEYIWIGGNNDLRSKTRILDFDDNLENIYNLTNYPQWTYDGSSTNQADVKNSECYLKPCSVYNNPFELTDTNSVLVLCSTYDYEDKPLSTNNRDNLVKTMESVEFDPHFGFEQEFYIMQQINENPSAVSFRPLGWNNKQSSLLSNPEPMKQGQYYCSVGSNNSFGREIVEKTMYHCLEAGINIYGMNSEVGPGQWELQTSPLDPLAACDQLILIRYILLCVSECKRMQISFDPKPIMGTWNGSGCHTNFSTDSTRSKDGIKIIEEFNTILSSKHSEDIKNYGLNNDKRLTGKNETSNYKIFTSGVGDRTASVRIPRMVHSNKRGYLEDRRPGANMDPYLVCNTIVNNYLEYIKPKE